MTRNGTIKEKMVLFSTVGKPLGFYYWSRTYPVRHTPTPLNLTVASRLLSFFLFAASTSLEQRKGKEFVDFYRLTQTSLTRNSMRPVFHFSRRRCQDQRLAVIE